MYKELDIAWAELTSAGQMFEVETVEALGRTIKTFKHTPARLRDIWSGNSQKTSGFYKTSPAYSC